MIRQFYLENEYGEKYYFNHKNQTLISQVSGLGFSLDVKYFEYSRFYSRSEYNIPLSEINETLIFLNGYIGYKHFVDYISRSNQEFKLHYVNDAFSAYCYVDITTLSKGELVANTIHSEIVFKKLSLWLKEKTYEIKANGSVSGKSYPYQYPISYSSSFEGKININNSGLDKAPLIIEIEGSVVDPEVIVKKNGNKVSQLRLYLDTENSEIIINSIPSKQEMVLTKDGLITDIYSNQDFQEDNFIFLDHGDYEIEFKPGVATEVSCKITVIEGYLGI
jgi:hypothetical protein